MNWDDISPSQFIRKDAIIYGSVKAVCNVSLQKQNARNRKVQVKMVTRNVRKSEGKNTLTGCYQVEG